jgi:hypothetical protein
MYRSSVLYYLDPCHAARLSREAKLQFSRAIRLMRRVMRSDGFPEIRRRIKLSQWNTVHGDRGQLRNGQSSPATPLWIGLHRRWRTVPPSPNVDFTRLQSRPCMSAICALGPLTRTRPRRMLDGGARRLDAGGIGPRPRAMGRMAIAGARRAIAGAGGLAGGLALARGQWGRMGDRGRWRVSLDSYEGPLFTRLGSPRKAADGLFPRPAPSPPARPVCPLTANLISFGCGLGVVGHGQAAL